MNPEVLTVSLPAETKPSLQTLLSFARTNLKQSGLLEARGVTGVDEQAYLDRDGTKIVKFTVKGSYKYSDIQEGVKKYKFLMTVAFGNVLGGLNGKQNAVS